MAREFRAATVPWIVAAILTSVYVATLAPGVTLWDAGEFLGAIHSLGIPHPPGTPLYVHIAAVWGKLIAPLAGFARSINLLSAIATAVGCAALGWCVARWLSSRLAGLAAGLSAGSMFSVWRSATETEVYALSFALALIALALADRAGRSGLFRDAALTVYVLALAVPVHMSALIIAPGVVLFAATDSGGRLQRSRALVFGGAALLTMALGTTSLTVTVVAVVALVGGSLTRWDSTAPLRFRHAVGLASLVLLAASAVAAMYFRAQHDPFVNQANPATFDGLIDVIGREQYDVPPLWPRRAPLWLQLGNLVQYADWQVAFGLDRWVGASLWRTPFTLFFAALAVVGASWHRACDRRSFRAFSLALLSASIGTVLVLNLRAGPSIGVGVLPDDALHEARERDYFFAIAFALCATWAGIGATRLGSWVGERVRTAVAAPVAALVLAAAPIGLNWRATDRSADGPITLAQRFATALLDASPPNAVLFVAGDNDTYPVWYLQRVHRYRPDVTVVTLPLLPAMWYRAELARRYGLLPGPVVNSWRGQHATVTSLAERARNLGRPLAVAVGVPAGQREALGRSWVATGAVYAERATDTPSPTVVPIQMRGDTMSVSMRSEPLAIDTGKVARVETQPSQRVLDPTEAYIATLLNCPRQFLDAARAGSGSVDPRCNLR